MKLHTTRRNFLGAAAGIAGLSAAGVSPASAKIEPEPWGIKLGIATYTFRSFDRAKTIEMLKVVQAPWTSIKDGVHFAYNSTPQELKQARAEFDAAGLKVTSAGNISLAKDDPDDIRQRFEIVRNLGLSMMVCIPTHSNIRTVEKFVKEYDMKIAIHNHGPEQKDFPSPQSVLEAVRDMDPRVGLCIDVGHTARTGVDVVESIALAGKRLFDMHVKDLRDFKSRDSQCDVGEGVMPLPAIFKQLKKMNYQGCVNLEYEINAKDPLPGVLRSMFYMRGVLAGLAAA
ncbi:MAG: sugar phosphate isomerase/epimerase [Bryobacteraceae bacterium]|jgi:sugar phosphate isomerase/epimerase